jgi:hypothetical protein
MTLYGKSFGLVLAVTIALAIANTAAFAGPI